MDEALKKQLEYDIFAQQGQGGISENHPRRYQGYELMGQAANPVGGVAGFNQISKEVKVAAPEPDRTTISQALTRRVERCEAEIKQRQQEVKELLELREALSGAKHFPVRVLRELIR